MHVYVIEELEDGKPTGYVKVGKADVPSDRLSGLRSGNPRELVVRAAFRCDDHALAIENIVKKELEEHRKSGEWFKVGIETACECIEKIIARDLAKLETEATEREQELRRSSRRRIFDTTSKTERVALQPLMVRTSPTTASYVFDADRVRDIDKSIRHIALAEVFKVGSAEQGRVVFHGAEAIRLVYGSDRASQGLDFLVADNSVPLPKLVDNVRARLQQYCSEFYPGSQVELGPLRREWNALVTLIKWTHPALNGVVRNRLYFRDVPGQSLISYGTRTVRLSDFTPSRLRLQTPILVAEGASLWADKIRTLVGRSSMKDRDVYDLVHLAKGSGTALIKSSADEAVARIESSMTFANLSLQDVFDGLRSILESGELVEPKPAATRTRMRDYGDDDLGSGPGPLDIARREVEWAAECIGHHLSLRRGL